MRRVYHIVDGSIGWSYDEIKVVTMSVSRDFHMLSEITTCKKVEKFDCLSLRSLRVIKSCLSNDCRLIHSKC